MFSLSPKKVVLEICKATYHGRGKENSCSVSLILYCREAEQHFIVPSLVLTHGQYRFMFISQEKAS